MKPIKDHNGKLLKPFDYVNYKGEEYLLEMKWNRLCAFDITGDYTEIDFSEAVYSDNCEERNHRNIADERARTESLLNTQ